MVCQSLSARRVSSRRMSLLHVRLDGGDPVGLGVFLVGDAAFLNRRQYCVESILGDLEIGHPEVVRDVLVAVQDLLSDPEGKGREARRDRAGPGGVAVLVL